MWYSQSTSKTNTVNCYCLVLRLLLTIERLIVLIIMITFCLRLVKLHHFNTHNTMKIKNSTQYDTHLNLVESTKETPRPWYGGGLSWRTIILHQHPCETRVIICSNAATNSNKLSGYQTDTRSMHCKAV